MNSLKKFLREEDGPTAVEYSVMLALIIITCLAAIGSFGSNLNDMFNTIDTEMDTHF